MVLGLSVTVQLDPVILTMPTHSTSVMDPVGIKLPVRSAPYGLSWDRLLELSVISNPRNGAVLLTITGTRSRVFGVVSGPLKRGGDAGHFVSVTCAMHTVPVDAPWTLDGKF